MSKFFGNRSRLVLLLFTVITTVFGNEDLLSSMELELSSRIVGGHEVGIIQHPYTVSVHWKACPSCSYDYLCGGTIYNEEIIITAAKCSSVAHEPRELHIVAGSSLRTNSLQDGGMIFPVDEIILHPNSDIDLALLRLAIKIPLNSTLMIAAVPVATDMPNVGSRATIVGWGQVEEEGPYSQHLREAVVRIIDQEICKNAYNRSDIQDFEICAGFPDGGVDACYGDTGGPMLVNGHLVGITSWGYGCARPDSPWIYTNVIKFNNWIVSHALGVHTEFL